MIACTIPITQNTSDVAKEIAIMLEKVKFGKHNSLSPVLPNVSVLNNLKTSENKRIADVLRGYEKGIYRRNGFKSVGK